jgi:hypothetical protein
MVHMELIHLHRGALPRTKTQTGRIPAQSNRTREVTETAPVSLHNLPTPAELRLMRATR